MMAGVVVYSSAPDSAMRWAILAFSAAAVFGVLGLIRLRRDSWLNVQKLDGTAAIALDVTKWTQSEVEEFTTYYSEWTREGPNQRVQGAPENAPSSSSGPEGRLG